MKPRAFSLPGEIEPVLSFVSSQENLDMGILFGSYVSGRMRAGSDLDMGILFAEPLDLPMTFASFQEALERRCPMGVDLVVLNRADPIIAMQILSLGEVFFARPGVYEDFFARTLRMYDDIKRIRAPIEKAFLQKAGGFSHE